jgi:hypothetical protein
MIATNPCERGGRLYVADRRDKIWTEDDIAAVLESRPVQCQVQIEPCDLHANWDLPRNWAVRSMART